MNGSAVGEALARVRGVKEKLLLPSQATNETGVQRTQSFAGVRGVPEKVLLPFLPPQAASQRGWKGTYSLSKSHIKNYYQDPKRRRKK